MAASEDAPSAEDMLYKQSVDARLEGLKCRVEKLREENGLLKRKAAKSEKDTHEFVAYFQNEIERKDQLIAKISDQLAKQELSFGKEKKAIEEASDAKVRKAESELEETKIKLNGRVKVLEDELAVLTEYKHKRDVLNNRLQEAERKMKAQAEQHVLEANDMERQFIEKSAKLQRDVDKRIEDIKRQAREEAQEGLDADTRKIIADNKRMGEELRFQLQTSDELQRQGKELLEENKRLKRNLSLANDKEREYARKGCYKGHELASAKQKIKALEHTISQTVREFDRNRAEAEAAKVKEVEDLELEVSGLKQLVKLKNKELRNIRHLSQVILDQRTEVEQYFLEALEQVKKEVAREREEAHAQTVREYRKQLRLAQQGGSGVKFPAIRAAGNHSASLDRQHAPALDGERAPGFGNRLSFQPGVKIELRDLSWADRERVLRLLFAKINSVENQTNDILKDATALGLSGYGGQDPDDLVPYRPVTPAGGAPSRASSSASSQQQRA